MNSSSLHGSSIGSPATSEVALSQSDSAHTRRVQRSNAESATRAGGEGRGVAGLEGAEGEEGGRVTLVSEKCSFMINLI